MTINWKNNLPLPMARPRYYDHQYLRAADLTQAVDYLLSRQNLAARLLRPVGVVSGLALAATGSDVTVREGVAVDVDGSVIVLPEDLRMSLPGDGTFHVVLRYLQTQTDTRTEGGVAGETRWTEQGLVEITTAAPTDPGRQLVLGQVTRQQGTVTVRDTGRLAAGLRVPAGAIVPTTGDNRQSGIQFPAGLTGDEAFIRYSGTSGENTVLRIANLNDPEDVIAFAQAGTDRLRIGQGMLHLGSLLGVPVQPDQVVAALGFHGPGVQHAQLSFRAGRGFELVDRSNESPSPDYPLHSKPYADLAVRELRANTVAGRGGLNLHADGQVALRGSGGLVLVRETGSSGDLAVQGSTWLNGDLHFGAGERSINAPNRVTVRGQRITLVGGEGVQVAAVGNGSADDGSLRVTKRAWVGDSLEVVGNLGVKMSPGWIPSDSGGGIATWDLYAAGAVYVGPVRGPHRIVLDGPSGHITATTKSFVIDHPLDNPAAPRRQLVHAVVEGPEHAVHYRGEGRLVGGAATVELPEYFEALTRLEGRTVQLTPVVEDDGPVSPLAASRVVAGQFRVRTVDGADASHAFWWQVTAVRADIEPLETEVPAPPRDDTGPESDEIPAQESGEFPLQEEE